jgi:hypothetical protein
MGTSLSSAVVSVVLAHEVVHLGPVTLPSSHGFTLALLISVGAAAVALAFSLAIPRPAPAAAEVSHDPTLEREPSRA